jgi:DNA-binding transcriptional LysR family regulator
VSVAIPPRLSVNDSAAILSVVEAGGGIGLVTDFAARAALAEGRVQPVLPDWAIADSHSRTAYAVYVPGPYLPLKIRAFIDYLAD